MINIYTLRGVVTPHYILTMDRRCLGLRNAQEIAIENHRDRVCSNSQATVSYRGVGGRRDTCGIRTIEKIGR